MKQSSKLILVIGLIFWAFMSCKKENAVDSNFELDKTEFIKFDFNNKVYDLKYKHKSGGYDMTNSLDGFFGVKNALLLNRQSSNEKTFFRATLVFENINPDTLKTFPRLFPFSVKPFETGAKLYFQSVGVADSSIFAIGITRNFDTAVNLGGILNISINDVKNGIISGVFTGFSNNGIEIKNGAFNVRYKK